MNLVYQLIDLSASRSGSRNCSFDVFYVCDAHCLQVSVFARFLIICKPLLLALIEAHRVQYIILQPALVLMPAHDSLLFAPCSVVFAISEAVDALPDCKDTCGVPLNFPCPCE
jgi:hypothetical protein